MTRRQGQGYLFAVGVWCIALAIWWVYVPERWFAVPYSLVLEDEAGQLLSAHIAADEQWRFPMQNNVSPRFVEALTTFEDQRFFEHNGVDPVALLRASWQNLRSGTIESGGSTLSMQVARLARGNQPRTVYEKVTEMLWAWHLEARLSKQEIVALYAAHAPFGGNVVGLEAASWRYFRKPPAFLSWAEAACLAVLPNAPGLLHPGRNTTPLKNKRDRLIKRLAANTHLSIDNLPLVLAEPLPGRPKPLPQQASYLMYHLAERFPSQNRFTTTLKKGWQTEVEAIGERHQRHLAGQEVHNLSIVVAEVATGAVKAYVGNVPLAEGTHQSLVDVARAPRSSGSILKPFLWLECMDEGLITPQQLLPDVPVYYGSFTPENYHHSYDGAVPAADALARSLNVPAVLLLQQFGVARFKHRLERMGLTTLYRPAEQYGLSLILGGAEVTLVDLVSAYRGIAYSLQAFNTSGTYPAEPYQPLRLQTSFQRDTGFPYSSHHRAGSLYAVLDMLTQVKRPAEEAAWANFSSGQKVAWKTGTSFGHRDAWAVGVTPQFVVGVWAGNADGEGRPTLTGTAAAAPILFDVLSALPSSSWFEPPYDDQLPMAICNASGHRVSRFCPPGDTVQLPSAATVAPVCPYHQPIFLSQSGTQVSADCYPIAQALRDTLFQLPPNLAYFYQQRHPNYPTLPDWHANCRGEEATTLRVIYPQPGAQLFLPRDVNGQPQPAVLEAVHARATARLYWHLNERYVGQTKDFHQLPVHLAPGDYTLTLVDDRGQRWESHFLVVAE